MGNSGRSDHWDYWRGVAILAVICIHTVSATSTVDGPYAKQSGIVVRQFFNFAVPLFFCISGFFAAKSWRGDSLSYWGGRGWRIIPPYLVWTTLTVLLKSPGHFAAPASILQDYFFGIGIGIGYYVIVLLQYVALVPVLALIKGAGLNISIMFVTMLIGMVVSYTIQIELAGTQWSNFPYNSLAFIVWAPFFQLGFWVGRNPDAISPRLDGRWLWMVGLAVLIAIAEGFYWDNIGLSYLAESQIKASSFLASLFVALHVFSSAKQLKEGRFSKFLVWLGRCSYLIYLSHMLILPTATYAVRVMTPDLYIFRPIAIALAGTLTAVVCIVLVLLVRKMTPKIVYRNLLGAN